MTTHHVNWIDWTAIEAAAMANGFKPSEHPAGDLLDYAGGMEVGERFRRFPTLPMAKGFVEKLHSDETMRVVECDDYGDFSLTHEFDGKEWVSWE